MNTATLNFTEVAVFTALRSFLLQIVPVPGTEVIRAQINRVPEPKTTNFILMTQVTRTRLATNTDTTSDNIFWGYISGTTPIAAAR